MSTNNLQEFSNKMTATQHYALRKLSVGVASVLLGTTVMMVNTAHADQITSTPQTVETSKVQNGSSALSGVNDESSNSQSSNSNEINNEVQQNNQNVLVANSSTGLQEQDQQSLSKDNNTSNTSGMSADSQNQRFAGLQRSLVQQSNNESSGQSVSDQAENVQIDAYNWHIWDGPSSDDPSKLNDGNPVAFGDVFRWYLKGSFDLTEDQLKSKSLIKVTTFGEDQTPVQSYRLRVNFPTNLILKDGTLAGTYLIESDGLYVQLNGAYKGTGSQNFSFDRVYCETGYLPTIRPFRGKGPVVTTLTWTFGNNSYSAKVAAPKVRDVLTSKNGSFTGSNTPNIYGPFGQGNEVIDWSIAANLTDAQRMNWLNSAGRTIGTGSLDDNSSVSYAFSLKADDTLIPSNVHIERYGETMGSDGKLYSNADEGFLNQYTFKGQLIDDYNDVQVSDNLSLAQLEVYSKQDTNKYDVAWWSRQKDGTLLFYAHFTPDQLKITRYDVLRDDANNRSTTNFDKDPEKAVQNTVDYYSKNGVLKGYPRWERFVFWIGRSDPTRRTTTTITYYDPSTFTVLNSVKSSGWGPSASVGVKGQSTVKLHVITPSGVALQQVKSFTDWPDQNKHASLTIPSITGYHLVTNPQSVLSTLHLSGTAISAAMQASYPAENMVADYYVVMAPDTESVRVNITDSDENSTLSSYALSGDYGSVITPTNDLSTRLESLLSSGKYDLVANPLTSSMKYSTTNNSITISLKHHIDSTQRHYRVIEDLPDGTKKVILDFDITLYKDAVANYYGERGAYLDGNVYKKLLKAHDIQIHVGKVVPGDPSGDNLQTSLVDNVPGYSWRLVDGTSGYDNGINVYLDSTKQLVIFDVLNGSNGLAYNDILSGAAAVSPLSSRDFHITYSRRSYPVTVNYYDLSGSLISSSTSSHLYQDSINVLPTIPANYVLAQGQSTHYTVVADNNELDLVVDPQVSVSTNSRTITNTINITMPDHSVKTVVRSFTFTRPMYINMVTHAASYGAWAQTGYVFPTYYPALIDGYAAPSVSALRVTGDSAMDNYTSFTMYAPIAKPHVPRYIDVFGKTYDTIPTGYYVMSGQRDDINRSQLIIKSTTVPQSTKVQYVTRTVTVMLSNGRQRVIHQRVRKGTRFGCVAVPRLRGYKVVISGDSQELGPTAAERDMMMTVKFVKM